MRCKVLDFHPLWCHQNHSNPHLFDRFVTKPPSNLLKLLRKFLVFILPSTITQPCVMSTQWQFLQKDKKQLWLKVQHNGVKPSVLKSFIAFLKGSPCCGKLHSAAVWSLVVTTQVFVRRWEQRDMSCARPGVESFLTCLRHEDIKNKE